MSMDSGWSHHHRARSPLVQDVSKCRPFKLGFECFALLGWLWVWGHGIGVVLTSPGLASESLVLGLHIGTGDKVIRHVWPLLVISLLAFTIRILAFGAIHGTGFNLGIFLHGCIALRLDLLVEFCLPLVVIVEHALRKQGSELSGLVSFFQF